jgi:hypothetical protein
MDKSAKILIGLFVALAIAVVILFVMKKKQSTKQSTKYVDPLASAQDLHNELVIDQQNKNVASVAKSTTPAAKIPAPVSSDPAPITAPIMDPSGVDSLSFLGNDW